MKFRERMAPGQTPYTETERARLRALVSAVAEFDESLTGEERDELEREILRRTARGGNR